MCPEPRLAVLLPVIPRNQHTQRKDEPPRQAVDEAMEVKPCEPQHVTAAGTLRVAKVTAQLPHVIVIIVAARGVDGGGWAGLAVGWWH